MLLIGQYQKNNLLTKPLIMKYENHFSRKKRQLSVLAKRLQYLLSNYQQEAASEIEKLILKIKRAIHELAAVLSKPALTKILGAAAFVFGLSFSNQSSAQNFDAPQTNPFNLSAINQLAASAFVDLDNDGDMDLLVGEYYGALKYFQNVGTSANPSFANATTNPFGLDSTYQYAFPTFVDIDADGDMDLFVGEYYGNIMYFKNIGSATNPQFNTPQSNPFGLTHSNYFAIPTFADLDGDGDMDLLVGEMYGGMKYYKNTGTSVNPQFAAPQNNPFGLSATSVFAAPDFVDIDGDGDMDLFVGEYYGAIEYFKNTGTATSPQFDNPLSNPFGLTSVSYYAFPAFADLDGDGDQDLMVNEYYGNFEYFKNLQTSIGIADLNHSKELKFYPVPVSNVLFIDSKDQYDKVEIFNSIGESVMTVNTNENKISVAELAPGIYTVTLSSDNGFYAVKKLIKQ